MRGKQIKQPGHLFSSERRAIGLCFLISYKHSIQVSGLSEKQKKTIQHMRTGLEMKLQIS